MSKDFIDFIIPHISKCKKISSIESGIDYDSDIIFLENSIIESEHENELYVMKDIQLYNFSFVNIKAKGNLKSLFNELSDSDKEVMKSKLKKVIKNTDSDKKTNKIVSAIYSKNLKQKKNLKMIYNVVDILYQIIEGKFKDNKLNELSEFIDAFYFDRDFLRDCVKQYNHIAKLKAGQEIEVSTIEKYFEKDFLLKIKYILTQLSEIKFIGSEKYKYNNFPFVDDNGNKFICKFGIIKNTGGSTLLPGWRFAYNIFQVIENTKLFKLEVSKEITLCKKNIFFAFTLLPNRLKLDTLLKTAYYNLVEFIKKQKILDGFNSKMTTESLKENIPKAIELLKSFNPDVIKELKSHINDILDVLFTRHVKLPNELKNDIKTVIENFNPNLDFDYMELLKLLDV